MSTEKTLKAYVVQDEYGGGQVCVRFAHRNVVARREGASEIDEEFGDVSCRRAPWADSYAPGPVPLQLCIEAGGWWQECACGCGRKIDNDGGQNHYEDDGDEGELNPMAPIFGGWRSVYWNQTCKDADEHRARDAAEAKVRDQSEVEAAVLAKFPFATDIVAFRGYSCDNPGAGATGRCDVLHARFNFPGAVHGAIWVIGSPTISIPPISQEAWDAAIASLRAEEVKR